ncbi:MAG: potassium channel protein [Chloroflexia bacterium]|nr:potassium channel protein [Chloroflexia bacterium]
MDDRAAPDLGDDPTAGRVGDFMIGTPEEHRRRRWHYRWLIVGRLTGPLVAFLVTLVVGTAGYMLIEGWSLNDAFYMVAMTVTTVGFGEVRPLSTVGRLFTVGLIFTGVMLVWYTMSLLVATIVESSVRQRWGRRRMDQRIRRTAGHVIVCGYGRVGRQAVEELRRNEQEIVVIDTDPTALGEAAADGFAVIEGDAAEDETLHEAGIDRAVGLISTVATDAGNVFVTLSARALRPDLAIVARAEDEDAVRKLRRAGANQVVSPYAMGGRQMAQLAVRPSAVDFVETLLRGADGELLLEDIRVADGAAVVERTVGELRRTHADIMLLAVQRDGRSLLPPPADLRLRPGDVLAAVGRERDLTPLERACASPAKVAGGGEEVEH